MYPFFVPLPRVQMCPRYHNMFHCTVAMMVNQVYGGNNIDTQKIRQMVCRQREGLKQLEMVVTFRLFYLGYLWPVEEKNRS